jgi:hypothetical protein
MQSDCKVLHEFSQYKIISKNDVFFIFRGLLVYPEGPLNPDMDPMHMSEMFRAFQPLLYKIRELLWTLSRDELWMLEKVDKNLSEVIDLSL